ncbi:adhesin [Cutibacterium namnetense]|uniref:Adhesin n=1 Tax=Cutibacterium namnetense TaxID=1574624 RepID=A0ABX9ICX8_9ACTN|nr:adhesin [Cutibacterium namnetense]REB71122.1 adhesin [Cutibacterium namnetense]
MTTCENTLEQQYRHAPLNGLATGAIVGTVWVLVFLGVYLKAHDDFTYINVALLCFVFPIIGWLTGLWERSACPYKTPVKQTRRIATIGAAMATITGLTMTTVCYAALDKPEDRGIPRTAAFSGKTFIVYFAPLIVFPIAEYSLGLFRSVLASKDRFNIFKMSLASIAALFACVITWLCFSGILGMAFFFTF